MLSRSFHSVPGGEELCAVVVVLVIKQHHQPLMPHSGCRAMVYPSNLQIARQWAETAAVTPSKGHGLVKCVRGHAASCWAHCSMSRRGVSLVGRGMLPRRS